MMKNVGPVEDVRDRVEDGCPQVKPEDRSEVGNGPTSVDCYCCSGEYWSVHVDLREV